MNGWLLAARRNPSAILLGVQLLGILVYPYLGEKPVGRAAFSILALLVLVLAVMAVRMTPALSWVAVLIGIPVVVLTIVEVIWANDTVAGLSAVTHAAFYFYTAYALIRYMFADHVIARDEVWATGATFTVVAWGFAYVYVAMQLVWPQSFTGGADPESARSWNEMLFLSVTTLTNTGLSDIVPALPQARSIIMLEEIAGMLYLALVVARIMALLAARSTRADQAREAASLEASTWEPTGTEPAGDNTGNNTGDEANDPTGDETGDETGEYSDGGTPEPDSPG